MNEQHHQNQIRHGQQIEIDITDMAFGGKGIGRFNGLAVFVDQTVPFDRVKAKVIKKKKNYAEGYPIEIIKYSPYRVQPACRYSGQCGGCKWQYIQYDMQLHYKQQHVIDCLKHIGLIQHVTVHQTIPSERIYHYRNKMEFTCSDRRWLLPEEMGTADNSFAIGLHIPGVFHKVLDTDACLLQPDIGNKILNDIKVFIKQSGVPMYGLTSHRGFWRFVMLRNSTATNQWMVNVITASENQSLMNSFANFLMEKYPEIVSFVNNITSKKAGIAVGEYEILIAGSPTIQETIGPYQFDISANSFFQTNTLSAQILYDVVKQYAGLTGKETVLDLYTGAGSIAIWLSDLAKEVIGLEIVESAISDAIRNCCLNHISNCRFILGDIRKTLPQIGVIPDVIIIDPPRVGMHKDVVSQVLQLNPKRIVYVSCNPSTLARDLSLLKESYEICEIQPIDMFPHTYHIECCARLERK